MVRLLRSTLVLACFLATSYLAAATVEIIAPKDYQVIQRQTRVRGVIHLEGKLTGVEGDIQFRITGKPLEGSLPNDWQTAAVDSQKQLFHADVAVPAGGWYRLEVRAVKNGEPLAQAAVQHVGVGEVFVVAGQSNSANYGESRQKPTSDRVTSFDGTRWVIANDPQLGTNGEGGSFIPAFGDAMVKKYGVPVGVTCLGAGGTSVRQWLPKGDEIAAPPTTSASVAEVSPKKWVCTGGLYERIKNRICQFGPQGFRAVLWHQGESDSHQREGCNITPEQYRQYLARLIQSTREAAGWKVPWLVAQVSYHTPADEGMPELRAAQQSLVTDGIALAGPNTDELKSEYREAAGQGVHFNARGLQRHGELWAEFTARWLDRLFASEHWESDIRRFEAADRANPPPPNAVLFVGSSGIVLWKTLAQDFPEYKVINRGFGGSQIADSVFYADRIITPYKPRFIVFRAGTNDIAAGKSPEQVFEDFKAFVTTVQTRLPKTKIVFLALNPSPLRWGNFAKESKANEFIKAYVAAGKNLAFVDIAAPMLGTDGKLRAELYAADKLHNSPEGYKLWVQLVRPHLAEGK